MSENTRSRVLLVGLVMAAALSSGALLPQTAYAAPEFAMSAQDDTRYTQEAAEQTPRDLGDGARPPVNEAVTRDEILARAKRWVDLAIPYDNNTSFETYRKDCSGFVSMAWKLADNRTTRTLDGVAHDISKEELLPGDALLWVNPNPNEMGHVRIFGGWLDAAKSKFWVYEQTPPKAVYRTHTWANSVANGYRPIRYDNVIEGQSSAGTMLHEARMANGNWTGFAPLGGAAKDIAVTVFPDGSGQVVAIGADDVVYHRARAVDGSWTDFAPLNGIGTDSGAKGKRVGISANLNGSAQVVIIGWDDQVYHRVRNADGGWTGFAPIGAAAKEVDISVLPNGSSQTVIVGMDDVVHHRARLTDGSWTPFAPLNGIGTGDGAKAKKVSIAGQLNGAAQVAIVGWDSGVYHRARLADGSWTEFAPLGATANDVSITAMTPDGSAQVLTAGTDSVIYHRVRGIDGSWTPFAPLEGFGSPAKGKSVSIAGSLDGSSQVAITSF
jgi:hypothetical protein